MRRFLLPPVLIAVALTSLTAVAQNRTEPEKEFDPFAEDAQEALEQLTGRAGEEAREFLDPEKVTALTKQVKPALVTVRQMGRDGGQRGTGSGFVVAKEGLVVTNLHVIGEGQPIEVEFADGTKRKVVEVRASTGITISPC